MIILGIPPLARRQDLRNNLPLPPFLISQLRHFTCNTLLFRRVVEDSGPVLRAGIWTLTVGSGGVVHAVEEFEELAVGDFAWIICDL